MPSTLETYILLSVLGIVLASLPVAMLCWRRAPGGKSWNLPPQPVAEAAQAAEAPLPPPAPATGWAKMDAWFAVLVALAVAVVLGPVSTLLMMSSGKAPEEVKIEYTASLFVTQIIFQAGIIGLILMWLSGVRKFNPVRLFGLREQGPLMTPALALLWLVGAYFALIAVSSIYVPLVQGIPGLELKQQGLVQSAPEITDTTTRVLMAITLCVGAPLMEEVIFRGVLFSVAAKYFHPAYAIVATSLLFGVIHNNLLSLIPLAVLGAFLAEAYRRTRSLAVPVLMHSTFNAISFLALMYGPEEFRKM